MKINRCVFAAGLALLIAFPAAAGTASLTNEVMKETVGRDAGGQVVTHLSKAVKVAPGDTIVYVLTYKNQATKAASGVVVTNPIPADLVYVGAADGPAPQVSADGKTFTAAGQVKASDVRVVRWVLADAVPAGGQARMTFRATVK